eukprot:767601-Hanusia_phi.AAC.1
MSKYETRLFIDGEFVNSISGKTFKTINPATEEVICEVQEALPEDVDRAVIAANKAFERGAPWREMDGTKRRDLLLKLADLMEQNKEELAVLESLNNGKPVSASHGDLSLAIQHFRYFAGWADKIEGKTLPVEGNFFAYTWHEPIGPVGQIIPWNFPVLMLAWKLCPALAAGCTVVLKSSEKTPLSALYCAGLIHKAGFPKGVVNIVSGFGDPTGKAIASHMDLMKIAFTGSSMTGRLIQKYAAESNMKNVSLELGGKSPLIILEDADLQQALGLAQLGLFLNQGQTCCASSRIFVQESIYDKFVELATQQSKARVVGDPTNPATMQGPQVDKIQFDRVMGYIEKGKKEGARLTTGGERFGDKGFFIQPTVFADVQDDMVIAKEEIFGPVMSLMKFKTVEEVIERANNTSFGLAAGVCTKNVQVGLKIARAIRAGTIWFNCFNNFDAAVPFGGYKESGVGREKGPYALENYLEVKSVMIPYDP